MRHLGHRIVGSIHSAARSKRNTADYPGYEGKLKPQVLENRFKRTLLNRSEEETDNVAYDAYATAVNAYPEPGRELPLRSEEHTSELQSRGHLVCRLLLEKKHGD